jgi:hypothetical protein
MKATWQGRPLKWDARTKREQDRIVDWTLAHLDRMDDEEAARDHTAGNAEVIAAIEKAAQYKPYKAIENAVKKRDCDALLDLIGDDIELARYAIRQLTYKSKGGRPKGRVNPGDYDLDTRWRLAAAAKEVKRIRQVWRPYGQANRKDPSAYEVALRRFELNEELDVKDLRIFMHRSRSRRPVVI